MNKETRKLRSYSDDKLQNLLNETRLSLMRAERRGGDSARGLLAPHPMFIRKCHKTMARINTILTERRGVKRPESP